MALFETSLPLNRQSLTWVNIMVEQGHITDAIVAGLTTVASLRAITFAGFETQRRFYETFQKAIDRAQAIGVLTDANIAATASTGTVAALQALFTTHDPLISAAHHGSMVM